MRPEEIRKLMGGYATGTLTEAEREALFAAALEDQELFNELAGEESLRELLSDPGARTEMLAAVESRPRVWAWWRPAVAALAVATIGTVIVVMPRKKAAPAPAPPPTIVAEVKPEPEPKPPVVKEESRPVPPRRVAKAVPPPVVAESPAEKVQKEEKPALVGGTAGGVLGGIMSAPRAAAPPLPPPPPPASPRNSFAPSTAGTVEVLAQASQITAAPTARALFFLALPMGLRLQSGAAGALPAQQVLGIRYSVVRDEDAGTVALRITANANGFVSVAGGEPVALTAMRPYTTPALAATEVRVVFARTPEKALTGPVSVLTETAGGEVYVVTSAPAPELGFTVSLPQK